MTLHPPTVTRCPTCHAFVYKSDRKCPDCGFQDVGHTIGEFLEKRESAVKRDIAARTIDCPVCQRPAERGRLCGGCGTLVDPEQREAARRWIWAYGVLLPLPTLILALAVVLGRRSSGDAKLMVDVLIAGFIGLLVSSPFAWGLTRALVELKRPVKQYGYSVLPLLVFLVYPISALGGPIFFLVVGFITLVFWADTVRGVWYLSGLSSDWDMSMWEGKRMRRR